MSGVRQRLRSWRGAALVVLVVALATAGGVLLARPTGVGALDPTSPAPGGTRALARVLQDHGVDVRDVRRFDDVRAAVGSAPDATVVLARPDRLAPGRGGDLRELVTGRPTTLVVVGAGNDLLSDLGAPVGAAPVSRPEVVDPGCSAATPTRAGDAVMGGVGYGGQPVSADAAFPAATCYRVDGRPTYVELTRTGGGTTVLLGSGAALTNDRLTDAGDAALALGTLGHAATVVWWTPDPLDGVAADEPPSLVSLLPAGVRFGAVQLVVVLLVLVLWRARRFGRLVPEPLPVVVRAAETTIGRGRLYRRARARGRAAQVLRAATVRRLAVRCGLPRTADVDEVVAAASALTGRPAADVASLLVGPDPHDDAHLVTLARDLQSLEREAQRP
ncbi:MAG: DUF4350 domain-containing protein [Angustibacter sp.]